MATKIVFLTLIVSGIAFHSPMHHRYHPHISHGQDAGHIRSQSEQPRSQHAHPYVHPGPHLDGHTTAVSHSHHSLGVKARADTGLHITSFDYELTYLEAVTGPTIAKIFRS